MENGGGGGGQMHLEIIEQNVRVQKPPAKLFLPGFGSNYLLVTK